MVRRVAIEKEIRSRLKLLQSEGKIDKTDISASKALVNALEEFIQFHPDEANIKKLKGIFSYDIKFNPQYTRALRMKDKIPELKKLLQE